MTTTTIDDEIDTALRMAQFSPRCKNASTAEIGISKYGR
jgi:hypothetical protein